MPISLNISKPSLTEAVESWGAEEKSDIMLNNKLRPHSDEGGGLGFIEQSSRTDNIITGRLLVSECRCQKNMIRFSVRGTCNREHSISIIAV